MPSQLQATVASQAPNSTPIIDPTVLIQHGNNPTAIILAIAILLWVLRPVMLQKSGSSNKK